MPQIIFFLPHTVEIAKRYKEQDGIVGVTCTWHTLKGVCSHLQSNNKNLEC